MVVIVKQELVLYIRVKKFTLYGRTKLFTELDPPVYYVWPERTGDYDHLKEIILMVTFVS